MMKHPTLKGPVTSLPISLLLIVLSAVLATKDAFSQQAKADVKHVKVYHEPGRYAGWPANHGIWIWDNEILVGFSRAYHKDMGNRHNIDREKVELHALARSKDGGETWTLEDPGKSGLVPELSFGIQRSDVTSVPVTKLDTKINFLHKDFALTARMGKDDHSNFWYSYDKGKSWKGPYLLPDFGAPGSMARTDYLIDSANEALLFLTVQKKNGKEGRVMCVKTIDGGKNWAFVSWIGDEPAGYSIMPASVRLSKNEILVTTRTLEGTRSFIDSYYSADNGKSWTYRGKAADDTGVGNPPAMIKMKDGRICLVYGFRSDPGAATTSDIRAKISTDNGLTWGRDYILRNDGSGRDVGYSRAVQRPDGKIVAVYYFMDHKTGPERYIGATIWTPPVKGN
jgi:hypothetical protein